MLLALVALFSFYVVGCAHMVPPRPSPPWSVVPEEVALDPRTIEIELGSSDTVRLSFRSDLERNVTIGFLYDHGANDLRSDPGGVIAPLDNVTLTANETKALVINATKPGHIVVVCTSSETIVRSAAYTLVLVEQSAVLGIVAKVVGWTYFALWTIGYYPQMISNWKRKSVVGLNFDFVGLNMIGQVAYTLFTTGMFWIQQIQNEYMRRHPRGVIPVEVNDVFYTIHGAAINFIIVIQCIFYERGGQRMSWTGVGISMLTCGFMVVTAILGAAGTMEWLDVLTSASYVKLFITLIRCIPQIYMNFRRKSTRGFSIGYVLLDIGGGILSPIQMILIASNHDDWSSIIGNPTKFIHALLVMFFDVILMIQHYVLYWNSPKQKQPLEKDKSVPLVTTTQL